MLAVVQFGDLNFWSALAVGILVLANSMVVLNAAVDLFSRYVRRTRGLVSKSDQSESLEPFKASLEAKADKTTVFALNDRVRSLEQQTAELRREIKHDFDTRLDRIEAKIDANHRSTEQIIRDLLKDVAKLEGSAI